MTPTATDLALDAAALAAASADARDQGEAPPPSELIAAYAELGAFRLAPTGNDLREVAALLRSVSRECLSSAFCLWAHRMVIEYLRATGRHDAPVAELTSGERTASIAMATAMQEQSGLGEIPTVAVPDGAGGYRVSGHIAWASNIAPGTLVLFPARVDDTDARVILTATVGDAGLTARPVENLLALGATASASLRFDDVAVAAPWVVADSLEAARAQRNTHLLLQGAFCLGLADRSLAETAERSTGSRSVLGAELDRHNAERAALAPDLAKHLADVAAAAIPAVTLTRYRLAQLAAAASRLELTLTGGRGYVTTSATNRRFREGAFLAVQSPSEVHLLADLARFGIDPHG